MTLLFSVSLAHCPMFDGPSHTHAQSRGYPLQGRLEVKLSTLTAALYDRPAYVASSNLVWVRKYNHKSAVQKDSSAHLRANTEQVGKTVSLSQFLERVQQPIFVANLELRTLIHEEIGRVEIMRVVNGRQTGETQLDHPPRLARLYALLGLREEAEARV